MRKEIRKGKVRRKKFRITLFGIRFRKHFFDDLYHPELLKADSIANANTGSYWKT
ncbi:MAG: hypothetical protein ACLU30_13830 [Odoribacter splanchnicus]